MDATTAAGETFLIFGRDPEIIAIKAVYLVIVVVIALIVQRVLTKVIRKAFEHIDGLPSATIFVNIARVAVWVIAALCVLYPVFEIRADGVIAALGVVSVAVSLGLKDTISNIFGGIFLMVGKVVHPGDYVTIGGVTGTVVDVTMRHTVVENRLDERVVIPNSVLNTTSIQRLPASSESMGTFEFTMESGFDPEAVAADLVVTIKRVAGDRLRPDMDPKVFFDSITPYGVKGQVLFYVVEGVPFGGVRDAMVRAVAQKEYFSLKGARALSEESAGEQAAEMPVR